MMSIKVEGLVETNHIDLAILLALVVGSISFSVPVKAIAFVWIMITRSVVIRARRNEQTAPDDAAVGYFVGNGDWVPGIMAADHRPSCDAAAMKKCHLVTQTTGQIEPQITKSKEESTTTSQA
uniref:Uncharacterized protein n=1 Tax=Romanomermis culicivorax TaxID=13658 RepID=A0A915KBY5_ROMCU